MGKIKYEDKSDIIDAEIRKRVGKWQLKAVPFIDFDDVSQIIRCHIVEKWHLWDQNRPIEPWVSTIIHHQIVNILRNHYTNFSRPCLRCPHNQGDIDGKHFMCGLTKSGLQDSSCADYAKWEKTKKKKFNVKIPLSLGEDHAATANLPEDFVCLETAQEKLHKLMQHHLSDKHYFIYKMIYIDGMDDTVIASVLNYKTSEKKRQAGYKQIKNLKTMYKNIAKKLIEKYDIVY